MEYLERHPVAAALVVGGLFVLMVIEHAVKRRRGTWVPYRRQPVPWRPSTRWFGAAFFVLIGALGAWSTIGSARGGQPGAVIMSGALTAFCAWLTWLFLVRGRDVSEERQEATRWRRPRFAWWQAAQFALLPIVVVIGSIGAIWNGHGTWWLLPFNLVVIAVSALLIRWALKMRVEDTSGPNG